MTKYYKISLEQTSNSGTLLFWKPEGAGYTQHLEDAGLYDEKSAIHTNQHGRDVALTRDELNDISEIHTIVECPLQFLLSIKKEKKQKKESNG